MEVHLSKGDGGVDCGSEVAMIMVGCVGALCVRPLLSINLFGGDGAKSDLPCAKRTRVGVVST